MQAGHLKPAEAERLKGVDMKIKELLKEIEAANKLNALVKNNEIQLVLDVDYKIYSFTNYKDYLKFFKEQYISEVVELMKNVEVKLNTTQTLNYIDVFGEERDFTFEVTLEQKRFF